MQRTTKASGSQAEALTMLHPRRKLRWEGRPAEDANGWNEEKNENLQLPYRTLIAVAARVTPSIEAEYLRRSDPEDEFPFYDGAEWGVLILFARLPVSGI